MMDKDRKVPDDEHCYMSFGKFCLWYALATFMYHVCLAVFQSLHLI